MPTIFRICVLALATQVSVALAQEFLPRNLLLTDPVFTHHVVLVEKATHTLSIFENASGIPRMVKQIRIASGKNKGDKVSEGDHKTPEGIYTFREFYSESLLKSRHGEMGKMYGSGAFTTDYPNIMDQRAKKTGGGIWLHSTDDETRIDKGLDSKGCVVVGNKDLKDISRFLDLDNTPVVVVQDVYWLNKTTWERNRSDLQQTVQAWAKAWQDKRFNDYISFYHPTEFSDRSKGGFNAYRAYKSAVFSRPDRPEIHIDAISALESDDYAVVTLRQDYRSAVINDVGKKVLYLKKDQNYAWKIVAELWEKMPEKGNVAFTPSARFFQE